MCAIFKSTATSKEKRWISNATNPEAETRVNWRDENAQFELVSPPNGKKSV